MTVVAVFQQKLQILAYRKVLIELFIKKSSSDGVGCGGGSVVGLGLGLGSEFRLIFDLMIYIESLILLYIRSASSTFPRKA
jgi:hypothetical protein